MGYRRDKEDRLLAQIEQKEGMLRRKGNWLPIGRMLHLKKQIIRLDIKFQTADQAPIVRTPRNTYLFSRQMMGTIGPPDPA